MHPFAFILHAQGKNLGPTYNQRNKSINTVFHTKMKKSNFHRWTSPCIPEIIIISRNTTLHSSFRRHFFFKKFRKTYLFYLTNIAELIILYEKSVLQFFWTIHLNHFWKLRISKTINLFLRQGKHNICRRTFTSRQPGSNQTCVCASLDLYLQILWA